MNKLRALNGNRSLLVMTPGDVAFGPQYPTRPAGCSTGCRIAFRGSDDDLLGLRLPVHGRARCRVRQPKALLADFDAEYRDELRQACVEAYNTGAWADAGDGDEIARKRVNR